MYTVGDGEVLSQAGLFFYHLLSLLLYTRTILHNIMKSLTLSLTQSPVTTQQVSPNITESHSIEPAVPFFYYYLLEEK